MNKRIEKKQIKQAIKSISTLSVRNGDTIVVTLANKLKLDELRHIHDALKKVYHNNNNNILFIPDTLSIESLDREQVIHKLQQLIDELK